MTGINIYIIWVTRIIHDVVFYFRVKWKKMQLTSKGKDDFLAISCGYSIKIFSFANCGLSFTNSMDIDYKTCYIQNPEDDRRYQGTTVLGGEMHSLLVGIKYGEEKILAKLKKFRKKEKYFIRIAGSSNLLGKDPSSFIYSGVGSIIIDNVFIKKVEEIVNKEETSGVIDADKFDKYKLLVYLGVDLNLEQKW